MEAKEMEHIRSSPHYPKSNGMAEIVVKIVKNILCKYKNSGTDLYLAFLN